MKAEDYLKNLTNQELVELVDELQTKAQYDENSPVRKAILAIYGEINILVLQVQQIIWPVMLEVTNRFKTTL